MTFIKTYEGEIINIESIAYLTKEYLPLFPHNAWDKEGVYKIVATMKDHTKITVVHFAEYEDARKALELISEVAFDDSVGTKNRLFTFDLWNMCGAVSDCANLIEDEEGEADE